MPRTLHTKRTRKWYKTILEKSDISKKKKKHVWLLGLLHIEGRLNEGSRLQRRKHKDENKAKQNKRNIRDIRYDICKPNARGQKFAPLVASQQGRANQHEPACFGLSSPWSFPSRSGIPLHAVVQPFFFFSDPFCHEKMFRPFKAVVNMKYPRIPVFHHFR